MPWNANDASPQAQANERFDGSVRSRKSSAHQQRGVYQQPDGPLYDGVTACRGPGGHSKASLIAHIFIGVIASIIVAIGLAML